MQNINIIYSDNIIPFEETNHSKCVASFCGVSEWELEKCIKGIMEDNPDVIFNVIQYSKDDNRLFLYTDKPILISSEYRKEKDIEKNLVSVINEVLKYKDDLNEELISLQKLLFVIRGLDEKKKLDYNSFKYDIQMDISIRVGYYKLELFDINYIDNTLVMLFQKDRKSDFKPITFIKENGELKVLKSESEYAEDILLAARKSLTDYYDYCLSNKPYNIETVMDIETQKENILASVSKGGIKTCCNVPGRELKIVSPISPYIGEISTDDSKAYTLVEENLDDVLRNIYVRISDCPSWCKQKATEARINEVKEIVKQRKIDEFWSNVFTPKKKRKQR